METIITKNESGSLVKAQHRFEAALRAAGCKQESIEYAVNCVDPFHDLNMTVSGYPDGVGGKSVVQAITRQYTIKQPAGIGDHNWDVHFTNNPALCGVAANQAQPGSLMAPVVQLETIGVASGGHNTVVPITTGATWNGFDALSKGRPAGLLEWSATQTGGSTFDPITQGYFDAMNVNDILSVDNARSRIIGFGFEIHNTTAELYQSGSVTVYRADSDPSEQQLKTGVGVFQTASAVVATGVVTNRDNAQATFTDADIGSLLIRERAAPPTTIAQATQMRSATWSACDGCLVPSTMDVTGDLTPRQPASGCSYQHTGEAYANTPPISFILPTGANTMVKSAACDVSKKARYGWMNVPKTTSIVTTTSVQTSAQGADLLETTFNRSGAYFTGLSPQTTLTLIVKVFIEQFPNPDSNLLPLASLTAPYDPHVFACLAGIYRDAAPGYPVNMNDTGDFFREMASAAMNVAEELVLPVLKSIPHPVAQGLAMGGSIMLRGRKKPAQPAQQKIVAAHNNRFSQKAPSAPQKPQRAKANKIVVRNKRGNGRRSK